MRAGAIIPEMEDLSDLSPRQLMTPEPKLLVSDTQSAVADGEGLNEPQKQPITTTLETGQGLEELVTKITKQILSEKQDQRDDEIGETEEGGEDGQGEDEQTLDSDND